MLSVKKGTNLFPTVNMHNLFILCHSSVKVSKDTALYFTFI